MSFEIFVLNAFLYILPAYICNSSAALFGGGEPLDFGKTYKGKRILGGGKTLRGTGLGIFFGTITGVLIGIFLGEVIFYFLLGLLLSIGAMFGDMLASFLKRQINIERGRMIPVLDQLDFAIFAILFGAIVYIPDSYTILFIIIVTPAIHLLVNLLGYLSRLKKVPW